LQEIIEQGNKQTNETPYYTVGDIVVLKSGGPPMTIVSIEDLPQTLGDSPPGPEPWFSPQPGSADPWPTLLLAGVSTAWPPSTARSSANSGCRRQRYASPGQAANDGQAPATSTARAEPVVFPEEATEPQV